MSIEWSDDLATGVDHIDEQHRRLITHINELLQACIEHRAAATVQKTFDFLAEYVIEHFDSEECLMADNGYPGLEIHRDVHARWRAGLETLRAELGAGRVSPAVVVRLNREVCDWFVNHVRTADRDFVRFLRDRNGSE